MGKGYAHGAPHMKVNPVMDHIHGTTNPHPAVSDNDADDAALIGAKVKGPVRLSKNGKTGGKQ